MKNKILVIDDDIIYRKIIQKLLCNEYSLILTKNSSEAFACIETENVPDLVLADLNLPDLSGVEFISLIKKKLNNNKIPIIVISGMDDENLKKELYQEGVNDYILKPIDRLILKEKIADLIDS